VNTDGDANQGITVARVLVYPGCSAAGSSDVARAELQIYICTIGDDPASALRRASGGRR
jgi:hypothetical protein